MLALMVTIVISIFVPAIGNYQLLGLTPADVPNVNVTAFLLGQHDIPAVRDGSLRDRELLKLAGIVTFPSFHTASAVLYAWAFAPGAPMQRRAGPWWRREPALPAAVAASA